MAPAARINRVGSCILIGMLLFTTVHSAGCRARARIREAKIASRVKPSEPRVYLVTGRTLVMPVVIDGAIAPTKSIAARLDDGRTIAASVYWIGVAPESGRTSWLPPAGTWSATPAAAATRPAGSGTWAVVADLPADAMGQGLWFGTQRAPIQWLPDPQLLRPREGDMDWTSPLGASAELPFLRRLVEVEAASPIRRWRHKLLTAGLSPAASASVTFSEPVLESLAAQIESRWQVALATLTLADPYVAGLVKRQLVATIDFGEGICAPAWSMDEANLDALLADLLNTRLQPAQQVERARAWLEAQRPAVAWVIDDAGQRDGPTGETIATIGVANLSERDTLSWTIASPGEPASDLVPVAGWSASHVMASFIGASDASKTQGVRRPASPATVEANIGKWSSTLPTFLVRTPANPPGVRIEPFRREWDLNTWMSGTAPMPVESEWVAGALLFKDAAAQGPTAQESWTVFIESRSPVLGADEVVRLWLGPFGAPTSVINASSSGRVFDEIASGSGETALSGAVVSRLGDVWTARIPIPARCIEPDGTIRLGIQRTDALTRRTSWPRPLLPWQNEPGRVSVDTKSWTGAEGRRLGRDR